MKVPGRPLPIRRYVADPTERINSVRSWQTKYVLGRFNARFMPEMEQFEIKERCELHTSWYCECPKLGPRRTGGIDFLRTPFHYESAVVSVLVGHNETSEYQIDSPFFDGP